MAVGLVRQDAVSRRIGHAIVLVMAAVWVLAAVWGLCGAKAITPPVWCVRGVPIPLPPREVGDGGSAPPAIPLALSDGAMAPAPRLGQSRCGGDFESIH